MPTYRLIAGTMAALLVVPTTSTAQLPAPGTRIRITAPQIPLHRQTGTVLWSDGDSLVLSGSGHRRWNVPPALISGMDISRGRQARTVVGLLIGTGVGLAVGFVTFSGTQCEGSGDSYGQMCWAGRAATTVAGAGLGALIGALVRKERWVPAQASGTQPEGLRMPATIPPHDR